MDYTLNGRNKPIPRGGLMKRFVFAIIILLFLNGCIFESSYIVSEKLRDRKIAQAIDSGKFAKAEVLIRDYLYRAEEIKIEGPPESDDKEPVDKRVTEEYYRQKYKEWMKSLKRYMSLKQGK